MKFIRNILLAVAATFALTANVNAQYNYVKAETTSLNGGTNNCAGTTTNTTAITLGGIGKASYVGLEVTAKYDGACTGTALFSFSRSVNGSTFETTPGITLRTAAGNGTTLVTTFQASQIDGVQALKLVSIANTNSAALTNITLNYLIKR